MKTKQCGNCEFWDKVPNMLFGECMAPVPSYIDKEEESPVTFNIEGKDCQVYKENS